MRGRRLIGRVTGLDYRDRSRVVVLQDRQANRQPSRLSGRPTSFSTISLNYVPLRPCPVCAEGRPQGRSSVFSITGMNVECGSKSGGCDSPSVMLGPTSAEEVHPVESLETTPQHEARGEAAPTGTGCGLSRSGTSVREGARATSRRRTTDVGGSQAGAVRRLFVTAGLFPAKQTTPHLTT
jgi:hypothetical protein